MSPSAPPRPRAAGRPVGPVRRRPRHGEFLTDLHELRVGQVAAHPADPTRVLRAAAEQKPWRAAHEPQGDLADEVDVGERSGRRGEAQAWDVDPQHSLEALAVLEVNVDRHHRVQLGQHCDTHDPFPQSSTAIART